MEHITNLGDNNFQHTKLNNLMDGVANNLYSKDMGKPLPCNNVNIEEEWRLSTILKSRNHSQHNNIGTEELRSLEYLHKD